MLSNVSRSVVASDSASQNRDKDFSFLHCWPMFGSLAYTGVASIYIDILGTVRLEVDLLLVLL